MKIKPSEALKIVEKMVDAASKVNAVVPATNHDRHELQKTAAVAVLVKELEKLSPD